MEPLIKEEFMPVLQKTFSAYVTVGCRNVLVSMLGSLAFGFCFLVLIKDRKELTIPLLFIVAALALFMVITTIFSFLIALLLLAAFENDVELMSHYTWPTIVTLCLHLGIAIFVPVVLAADGRSLTPTILTWLVVVLIVGLCWTHFVSVIDSHRTNLLYSLSS